MNEFTHRVAMVTGAGGNLGRAVVDAFLREGARVAMIDHRGAAGDAAKAVDDRRFVAYADLGDAASTQAAVDAAVAHYGRIDVLCNVAGGFTMGTPVHETPDDVFRRMFDVNAMSVVHTARAVVPAMIAAGGGRIVNVAAASARQGQADMSAYIVAKSAVIRLTECMAAELRRHRIAVTCVLPTTIDTPQNRQAMPAADTASWTPAAKVADVVLMLASATAGVFSGSSVPVYGS
jgi:NAD(P)-dependent dehydrogenase (short-subunit alcohol dehydrogenase family)